METTDIAIIGAGIIGLATAEALTQNGRAVFVLEKNSSFGQETSSRNSEVIHSGIYYPQDSLKAHTCIEGNRLIYEICQKNNIAHKKIGKLVVATDKEELAHLQRLYNNGRQNGVPGLTMLEEKQMRKLEPEVRALAAIYSPSTGIVDSHNLMRYYFQKARAQGAEFSFQTEAIKIKQQNQAYLITVRDADGSDFSFLAQIVVNCAGLNSDIIAALAGIDLKAANYELKFCKGEYFRMPSQKSRLVSRLIYPVPEPKETALGIHVTPDLGGGLRLGPDAQYIQRSQADYNIDEGKKITFAQSVQRFLPFIRTEDLTADTAGIRPKLQGPNETFRDFVINHEQEKGLPGLINLIGIDSPGLTCAPAIARYVQDIVDKL